MWDRPGGEKVTGSMVVPSTYIGNVRKKKYIYISFGWFENDNEFHFGYFVYEVFVGHPGRDF